jgi:flagellin
MAMNSINTNAGALVALQSLNRTNDEMGIVQKRISTGLRVADAKDDGAAFAVAQKVRGDMAGLTSANEQLGGVKGILDTTMASLTKVSDTMKDISAVLGKLADDNLDANTRTQYTSQYNALRDQVTNFLTDADYNGKTLMINGAPTPATDDISTTRNELGATYKVAAVNQTTFIVNQGAAPASMTAAEARASLNAGDFVTKQQALATALNTFGNDNKYVDSQIGFNKSRLDSMETGLGALIDADLAKESARMQSLQIKQQLGTQSLSSANQAPQALLSLFR